MADKVKLVSGTRIYMDVRALLDDVLDITVNSNNAIKGYKIRLNLKKRNLPKLILLKLLRLLAIPILKWKKVKK